LGSRVEKGVACWGVESKKGWRVGNGVVAGDGGRERDKGAAAGRPSLKNRQQRMDGPQSKGAVVGVVGVAG